MLTNEQVAEVIDLIHSGFASKSKIKDNYNIPMEVVNSIYNKAIVSPEEVYFAPNDDDKLIIAKLTKRKQFVRKFFETITKGDLVLLNHTQYYKVLGVYKYNFILLDNKETISFADLYTGETKIKIVRGY